MTRTFLWLVSTSGKMKEIQGVTRVTSLDDMIGCVKAHPKNPAGLVLFKQ